MSIYYSNNNNKTNNIKNNEIRDNNLKKNLFSLMVVQIILILDVTDTFIRIPITNFYFNFILLYWVKKYKLEDTMENSNVKTSEISYINFFVTLIYVPNTNAVSESYNFNLPLTEEEFKIFYVVGILTGQILQNQTFNRKL